MATFKKLFETHFFLLFCGSAIFYCIILLVLQFQFAYPYSNEMLALFILPVIYSAHRFPQRMYIQVTGIFFLLAILLLQITETNPFDSYSTLFFFICALLATGELLFRSNKKWRTTKDILRESEQKYRTLFEKAEVLVSAYDRRGTCLLMNKVVAEIFGGTPDDYIGKQFSVLHPEAADEYTRRIRHVIDTGTAAAYEDKVTFPGKAKWLLSSVFPMRDDNGAIYAAQIISQDITERKQAENALAESEQRLATLMGNLPGMAYRCEFDRDWTMIFVSEGTYGLTGYHPEELINNQRIAFADLIHPDDRLSVWDQIQEAHSESKHFVQEYRIITANGMEKWVWERGQVIYDSTEKVRWIEGFISDISDRKQAEDEKLKLEEALYQSQKMEAVGTLAGGIAHDFNNILTAILGYSQILMTQLDANDESYTHAEQIQEAGERAASLTQQLLAFSRKQIIRPKVLDINTKITDMQKMLQRLLGEDVDILITAHTEPCTIKADPGQIDQIIMNLAVNARDAMPSGGQFCISTATTLFDDSHRENNPEFEPGRYVQLSFSDTGYGIPKEIQDKIFDPFFTTKDINEGTGLGLSTVYGIVKQNNGYILVDSIPGNGAIFHVFFPLAEETISDRIKESIPSNCIAGTETILIVEDDEQVRQLLIQSLTKHGYTVYSASNMDEAIQVFTGKQHQIDLLLTDMILPQGNGKDIAQTLSAIKPALKIIFMSGYIDNKIAQQTTIQEDTFFLQKPFSPDLLMQKIHNVLNGEKSGLTLIEKESLPKQFSGP